MTTKERVKGVLELLDIHYPQNDKCYLDYGKPYELMIATILSAQCTDDRVNIVTASLFKKYPSLEAFAFADVSEMEKDVKSTGFYRNKAKNIIEASRAVLEIHNSEMPSDIDMLTKLAGVGRKTANVIRSNIFRIPSVVVDTHVKRISHKLGFTKNTDPEKIEQDLMKILPKAHWIRYNTQIIAHGRAICKAPTAKCELCFMTSFCKFYAKSN
ncbi:MAG: endonuclease III [Defluviitaleaceae bacterium]|nr:endonuclease III [Defluviitaleaceae bacterium]